MGVYRADEVRMEMIMRKQIGVVIDMYTGMPIPSYPIKNPRLEYDFLFSKGKKWMYMNSFDDINQPLVKEQEKAVLSKGKRYRIVRAMTGEIVRRGG